MNISVLCRACMKNLEVKELHHVDVRAIKMYNYCTKIVFDEICALPKHFCTECTLKIKSTFSFIRKAQTVNETLKNFILALNHPSNIINKSLDPRVRDKTTTGNKSNDDKIDPRSELEQALHYLGTKYDKASAIDDADEAVDNFFKNLEKSEALVGQSTADEKAETEEINQIYNFAAPLLGEKSNEESLLEATSKLHQNMKTFAMKTSLTGKPDSKESESKKSDSKHSDTKHSDTKHSDSRRRHSKKSKTSGSERSDSEKEKRRSERSKSKKDRPSENILGQNKDSSSKKDPNMIILKPNLSEPYDKNAKDPIAISTATNADKVNGTANGGDTKLVDVGKYISDNGDKINNCPMCGTDFLEDSALQEHILVDHSEDREEFAGENNAEPQFGKKTFPSKCDLCDKIFNSPAWYNKHLEREHNNRIFKCEVCNKVYISYNSWKEHKKIHAPHSNCICPVCQKHFRKTSQLTEHMVIHNDERPFPCDQCHKRFKLKAVLTKHKKVHDLNRKKILCQYCGNGFLCERSLREHMVRHTGSLPFECSECSFRCQYKATYQRHKLRHSLYRPHECNHCKKAFYSSDDLKRHIRTHTGERPYKCPYCDRSFAEHNKRKAHMVNHHQLIFEDIPRLNRDGTLYVGNASHVEEATTAGAAEQQQTSPYPQETSPHPGCSEVFTFTVLPENSAQELPPGANPVPLQVLPSGAMSVQDIPMEILPAQALPHQKVTFRVDENMPIQELTALQVLPTDVLPAQQLPTEVSIQDMPIMEIIREAPMN